ncbi:MAG: DUF2335 domain-containing protein [Fusobacteriaceae bacterium]
MNSRQHKGSIAKQTSGNQQVTITKQEAYQGPLPHPDILKGYAEVVPTAAERILIMAEKEQSHRHKLDKDQMFTFKFISIGGLCSAFFIALVIIFGGIYLIIKDKPTQGFALVLGAVGAIVGAFVYKSHETKKQEEVNKKHKN